jgi:hypothetical protein
VSAVEAAREAARDGADHALTALTALLARLYPGAAYLTVSVPKGAVALGETFDNDGAVHVPGVCDGRTMLAWTVGDRPLAELPRKVRDLLGPYADDRAHTLNRLLTECWQLGARLNREGRPGTARLTLR